MTSPRIGWIPSSPDFRVASTRLRCALPARYLAKAGWASELLDRREPYGYDLVVFQKVYDETALELATDLKARGTRIVFDVCDNHLYNPDRVPKLAQRAERLLRMLDLADGVSVSTKALGELLPRKDAMVVDDALDEYAPLATQAGEVRTRTRWRLRRNRARDLSLVWYGGAGMESPSFGLPHLRKIVPLLNELNRELSIGMTVISNSRTAYRKALHPASFPSRYVEWSLEQFPSQFAGHDVCVIPIEVNPFTLCKTGNRIALSLVLGVPVVADRIPSFGEFERYVLFDDWVASLRRYAEDPELRRRSVREGGEYVRASYTPERAVDQWSRLFLRTLEVPLEEG